MSLPSKIPGGRKNLMGELPSGEVIDRQITRPDYRGMSKPEKPPIERGGLFIISYQLEGLCNGLRLTVPHGLAPGKETVAIIHKLRSDFLLISTGRMLKDMPEITETSNPVDILVFAETLRTSVLAFLSPEEVSEHRQAIGFHSNVS